MRSGLVTVTAALAVLALSSAHAFDADAEYPDLRLQPLLETTDTRDREGLRRDTWYFLGYQWIIIGILYVAPESVSGWSDEQKEGYDMSFWWENVTNPQIDSDDFYLNYILHPYWGAAYYVRARERGYSDTQAFWYSAMLSSMYEFGAEALFEEVSIQDVFVTPIFGSLLGKYFMDVRDDIRDRDAERGYRSTGDKWIWVLTDPLGAMNNGVDRVIGRKDALQIRPYRYVPRRRFEESFGFRTWDTEPVYGIEFRFEF